MKMNTEYIAGLLKERRHALHLKQWQVAQALKVDRSTYAYYETGKTIPKVKMLMELSKIFHVSMSYFLLPDSASRKLSLQDIRRLSAKEKKLVFDFASSIRIIKTPSWPLSKNDYGFRKRYSQTN